MSSWSLFIFKGHSTWKPVTNVREHDQGHPFYSARQHGKMPVLAVTKAARNKGEDLGDNEGE